MREEYSKLASRRDKLREMLNKGGQKMLPKHRVMVEKELSVIRTTIKDAHRNKFYERTANSSGHSRD